jgi:hypothetical protein
MACPPNAICGFISFSAKPDATTFTSAGTTASPFFMNFAPRNTPITLIDGTNQIQEDPQNTITYKAGTYTIYTAQICRPASGSYSIYGILPMPAYNTASIATIIFTYVTNTPDASHPEQLLLIVPIYIGNERNASGYLTQLLDSTATNNSYPSLQQLFQNQPSFGYLTSLSGKSVMMYTFINGIVLTQEHWSALQDKLPNSICPAYIPKDGLRIDMLPGKSPTDQATKNSIIYYPVDIQAVKARQYNTQQNLEVSQYQCQPFDELKNLQTDPGGVQRVNLKDVITNNQASIVGMSISMKDLYAAIIPIAVIVGLIIVMTIYFYWAFRVPPAMPPGSAVAPVTSGPPT